mmetsp:Transcript_28597/g.67165  ORF Transcript_28597/g.67165 Transcript_28597/m.67165 type:complete len:99 (-) Transcript_28597:321-617(-)
MSCHVMSCHVIRGCIVQSKAKQIERFFLGLGLGVRAQRGKCSASSHHCERQQKDRMDDDHDDDHDDHVMIMMIMIHSTPTFVRGHCATKSTRSERASE